MRTLLVVVTKKSKIFTFCILTAQTFGRMIHPDICRWGVCTEISGLAYRVPCLIQATQVALKGVVQRIGKCQQGRHRYESNDGDAEGERAFAARWICRGCFGCFSGCWMPFFCGSEMDCFPNGESGVSEFCTPNERDALGLGLVTS